MKKKIAILGSTGSIGQTTFNIIKENKKNFKVLFLSTNSNVNKIYQQAKELNVKNIIINNKSKYKKIKKKFIKSRINVYFDHSKINKFLKSKLDYCMCSISGLEGLGPTLNVIKLSKSVGIANKESLICAWNLIEKKLKKHKTNFIPVDSEHFSIWSLIKNSNKSNIEEIILTASGGPFLNLPISEFKKIKISSAVKHPNWSMGKKISIDSATLMNKVFEIIEAQRIFNIDIKKFEIIIHPSSYIHSIIKLVNGQIKILAHETDMKIPIFNSLYNNEFKSIFTKKININLLNNLNLKKVDPVRYPSIKILNKINNKNTLFETVLISANDQLVELYIKNKIKFVEINLYLKKILNFKKYLNLINKKPKKISDIINLSEEVRLKTRNLCIQ